MKDLYTFDSSKSLALATYDLVRNAYAALFDELKIPYLVAEADSGDMGGNLSHEFHFLTPKGEDRVINCRICDYVTNEELAKAVIPAVTESQVHGKWSFIESSEQIPSSQSLSDKTFSVWRGITRDRTTLINVWFALPSTPNRTGTVPPEINIHAVKSIIPDLDSSVENGATLWKSKKHLPRELGTNQTFSGSRIINLVDYRLPEVVLEGLNTKNSKFPVWPDYVDKTDMEVTSSVISKDPSSHEHLDLLRIQTGDSCPKCGQGRLDVNVAIELGHAFFLGTQYSEPFKAFITLPPGNFEKDGGTSTEPSKSNRQVLMQMGCYGIGVSRMIGAVAETLADEKGLNWPRIIAPYEVVIVPTPGNELDAVFIYDALIGRPENASNSENSLDIVLDDRENPFPWKMKDADLIGYPVIVVVGKDWKMNGNCEVQCRRLRIRENVPFEQLRSFIEEKLLQRL
jgi:prolyl-tRNA synthetase